MGYSTIGFLTNATAIMRNNRQTLQLLESRLGTGKKFSELKGYGILMNRIVNLRNVVNERTDYQKSIEHAQVNLKAYEQALKDLDKQIGAIREASVEVPSETDTAWDSRIEAITRGALLSYNELFNYSAGGRYIFSGERIGEQPAVDVRNLHLYGPKDALDTTRTPPVPARHSQRFDGTDATALHRLPQWRYQSQTLVVNRALPDVYVSEGSGTSLSIDLKSFTKGAGETLSYSTRVLGIGSSKPEWFAVSSDGQSLNVKSGAPQGTYRVEVLARNNKGEKLSQEFSVHVQAAGVSLPPSVRAHEITEATSYTSGEPVSAAISDRMFSFPSRATPDISVAPGAITTSDGKTVPAGTFTYDPATRRLTTRTTALAADLTGDFSVTLRASYVDAGGTRRTIDQEVRFIDREIPEYEYQSYLSAWKPTPQPAGLPIPPSEPYVVDEKSWSGTSLTIADNRQIDYAIKLAGPAFQKVMEATMRLRSATQKGLSEEQRHAFVRSAYNLAREAQQELASLATVNTVNVKYFDDAHKTHKLFINYAKNELGDIESVNTEETAVELVTLRKQIEASYQSIAGRSKLSLTNYL